MKAKMKIMPGIRFGKLITTNNIGTKFVLPDVSKQELEKRRIPVYSYLL